jgi:hypothetical protein
MKASDFAASELSNQFDFWGNHPEHSLEDWQTEVADADTRLGYWDWVICRCEQAEEDEGA